MTETEQLHLMDHPLILHKLSLLRSKDTDMRDFRGLVREISLPFGANFRADDLAASS